MCVCFGGPNFSLVHNNYDAGAYVASVAGSQYDTGAYVASVAGSQYDAGAYVASGNVGLERGSNRVFPNAM